MSNEGQVPSTPIGAIGIVGDGRAACHFAFYLHLLGIPYRQWSRRLERIDEVTAPEILADCELIFVLLQDSAIESWILAYSKLLPRARFVHFSGALVTKLAIGVHPLMTFGRDFYRLEEYQGMAFVGEEDAPALSELVPGLTNPYYAIAAEQRPLYHALCVMSGNFSVILWQKLFGELEQRFGIPREAAAPYLKRVTGNLLENAEMALTGPLARKDFGTLRANLRALEGDRFEVIYQAFIDAIIPPESYRGPCRPEMTPNL